jgi:chemotaxis family two-component system response regulator PixG
MLTALEHLESLKNLEQFEFSGQVQVDSSGNCNWTLYFFRGQLIFTTGGAHPVRRWRRCLMAFCPNLPTYRLAWQIDLAKIQDVEFAFGWQYALLRYWVLQRKITSHQARQIVSGLVAEVVFDLVQISDLTIQFEPSEVPLPPIECIQLSSAIEEAEQQWHRWQLQGLENISLHHSPIIKWVIKWSQEIKQINALTNCQDLAKRLDGQSTFYELAVDVRQPVIDLASALLPFIQSGCIDVVDLADLPTPIYRQRLFKRSVPPPPSETRYKGALIACVDDSAFIRNMMEQVLTTADYEFLGIEDPLRAIGVLLARKPDLIFLDLIMPQIGGHELCEKLRKLSCFKTTPIIILTGNDGYVNRLRSNSVGASDFLAKPLDAKEMLGVVHKHLAQGVVNS